MMKHLFERLYKSIRLQFVVAIVLAVATVLLVTLVILARHYQFELKRDTQVELRTVSVLLQRTLSQLAQREDQHGIAEVLAELSLNPKVINSLILQDVCYHIPFMEGDALGCVDSEMPGISQKVINEAKKTGISRYVYIPDTEHYIAYIPLFQFEGHLKEDRQVLCIEYLAKNTISFFSFLNKVDFLYLLFMLFCVGAVFWAFSHRVIVIPLGRIMWAVHRLSKVGGTMKIPVTGSNELSNLARALERMAEERYSYSETAALLNNVVNKSQDSIYITDTDHVVIYINDAFTCHYGYKSFELIGRKIHKIWPDTVSEARAELIYDTLDHGETWEEEAVRKHKNGEEYISLVRIFPICDEDGNIEKFVGVHSDITATRKLEQINNRLQQVSDKFFEQSSSLHLIATLDGIVVRINKAWESVLGYSPKDVIDKKFTDYIHPDDLDATYQEMSRLERGLATLRFENRYYHSDGSCRSIRWSADASPSDGLIFAVGADVTEELLADQKLLELSSAFESSDEGMTLTDRDGNIKFVNEAFTKITGFTGEEVVGKNPRVLQSGIHDHLFYFNMWTSLEQDGSWRGEIWNRRKSGEVYPELLTISAIRNEQNVVSGYVAVFSDISKFKEIESNLNFLAHHDPLTKLPNRLLLSEHLAQSINNAKRHSKQFAVLFIDIDHFKNVNDSLGHTAGDALLKQLSERLSVILRVNDFLARLSGDEFVILLEDIDCVSSVERVLSKIMALVRCPFTIGDKELRISVSIGISLFPESGATSEDLLRNSDSALYHAKDLGRNTAHFYTENLTTEVVERFFLESELRSAIENDQLKIFYQPQVDLKTRRFIGMESLLRWFHPEKGLISPARFIPVAERCGLINDIGAWVLENVCQQAQSWHQAGYDFGRVSVNVSGPQLHDPHYVSSVKKILDYTGLPIERLELEVTESVVVLGADNVILKLAELTALGISIAIDDFGTGYSSLSYLKTLPFNKLKIDQSFVCNLHRDANDLAIVKSIISLAHSLNADVIAEGVELQEQADILMAEGCNEAQGYLYGRPVPPDQLWFVKTPAALGIDK
ncbi:EAL domain-containing protein [Porticoccus sp.]